MKTNTVGFTLIELLVVVLIIGVLAAIALPQYQRAVWKSKAVSYQQQLMEIVRAEELYYSVHGEYTKNFDDLEWKPALPKKTRSSIGNEDIVFNLWYGAYHPTMFVSEAVIQTGPYARAGFRYIHNAGGESHYDSKQLYCIDPFSTANLCMNVLGLPATWNPTYGVVNYRM